MRVHLSEGPNLCQIYILTVAQGNNFIKGKDQVEAVFRDLILFQSSTILRDLEGENILKEYPQTVLCKHFLSTIPEVTTVPDPPKPSAPLRCSSYHYIVNKQDEVLSLLVFLH